MPEETRNYVPKLQAIKNIIHNPVAYNIQLPKVDNAPYFTTVRGPSHMDVEVAAMLADMPLEEFMFLNPAYTRDRSEEHTSELQSRGHLVCRLLLEKKK